MLENYDSVTLKPTNFVENTYNYAAQFKKIENMMQHNNSEKNIRGS